MRKILYLKFQLFFLMLFIAFTGFSAENPIKVIYPRKNQKVNARKNTFILGSVPKGAALSINGQQIKVYRTGGFLAFLPVEPGDFSFNLEVVLADGTKCKETIPVRIPLYKPVEVTKTNEIEEKQFLPNVDTGVILGDEITFQCKTIPGQDVKVSLKDEEIPLFEQPEEAIAGIYRNTGQMNKVMEDESFTFSVSGNDTIPSFTPSVKITVQPPGAYPVLEVVKDNAKARFYPGGGYDTFLKKGTRLKSFGHHGRWQKLYLAENHPVYVQNSSLKKIQEGTAPSEAVVGNINCIETDKELIIELPLKEKVNGTWFEFYGENKLAIKLYNTKLNVDRVIYPLSGILKNISWQQIDRDVVQLDFFLSFPPLFGYWIEFEGRSARIIIKKSLQRRETKDIKICLDAGHGDADPGAVGPTGVTERESNLKMVLAMEKKLKEKGFDVILTRKGKGGPTLYERAPYAFTEKADIFISVHSNACADGVNPYKARSTETYFYNHSGKNLGSFIHPKVVEVTQITDAGLKFGNLAVCRNNAVPSILIEVDYLLIPEAEERIVKEDFCLKIAESVCKGVEDYISYKHSE